MIRQRLVRLLALLFLLVVFGGIVFVTLRNNRRARVTIEMPSTLTVNRAIEAPVFIDTHTDTINAAEVYLTFDPTAFRVESVSKDNSFFKIWIDKQPAFSNEAGTISFAGGLPTPGFQGRGQVGVITLLPLKKGSVTLTFDPKTRILKNDGSGTTVPLLMPPITTRVTQ